MVTNILKNNGDGAGENLAMALTIRTVVQESFGSDNPDDWYGFGYSN